MLEQLGHWLGLRECPGGPDLAAHTNDLLASLLTMAWLVEARDPYTGGHLWRVSLYARMLAERAGFHDADAARISLGGFLHDLGKVGVPDAILRNTEALTEQEYAVIKTHPEVGVRLIAGHPLANLVADAILSHHERPDGQGYPHGLAGDAVPPIAQIVGICDAFDAMTSDRPYRRGFPRAKASAIIRELSGRQFAGAYASLFAQMADAGQFDQIIGHSDHGIPLLPCMQCGNTLTVRREQHAGEKVYCHNCGDEYALEAEAGHLAAIRTGAHGTAADLQPQADPALVRRTVRALAAALPQALSLSWPSAGPA